MTGDEALREASDAVEAALRRFMDGRTLPLYTMMAYHLGWVNENGEAAVVERQDRVRGAVCLYAAEAAGGQRSDAALPAAAVELLYNYSLIHFDIQEGNPDRGARPALWWVWGPAQGINAGDGMHALARLALFSLREHGVPPETISAALKTLDTATLRLCEGAYLDTVFQERLAVSTDDYMEMARSLAGSVTAASTGLGLLSAGASNEGVTTALADYGESLGTAMRISEDYQVFWGGEDREPAAQGRLIAKKKTLPVVYALENASMSIRRELGNMYAQRVIDPAGIDRVRDLLESSGSREYTEGVLNELGGKARSALVRSGLRADAVGNLDGMIDRALAPASNRA